MTVLIIILKLDVLIFTCEGYRLSQAINYKMPGHTPNIPGWENGCACIRPGTRVVCGHSPSWTWVPTVCPCLGEIGRWWRWCTTRPSICNSTGTGLWLCDTFRPSIIDQVHSISTIHITSRVHILCISSFRKLRNRVLSCSFGYTAYSIDKTNLEESDEGVCQT